MKERRDRIFFFFQRIPHTMVSSLLSGLRLLNMSSNTNSTRSLATLVSNPSYLSNIPKPIPALKAAKPIQSPGNDKNNKFIVSTPSTISSADKISIHSSKIKGRGPQKPRKALNDDQTALAGEVKIFLPSVFMRLVRNSGAHAGDPYTATFRTDLRLNKPDISNYLKNVYGLSITSLRTINYLSAVRRNPIGGGYSRKGATKNYKKVMVTMEQPFWYPTERSREWCNEHFERDRMEEMRDRKMLKIGDGQKYGVSSPRYRGASKPREQIERLAELVNQGGLSKDAVALAGDGNSVQRRPAGLKMKKNVLRSREERVRETKSSLDIRIEQLKADGW
jgi:ribosomal protein L23